MGRVCCGWCAASGLWGEWRQASGGSALVTFEWSCNMARVLAHAGLRHNNPPPPPSCSLAAVAGPTAVDFLLVLSAALAAYQLVPQLEDVSSSTLRTVRVLLTAAGAPLAASLRRSAAADAGGARPRGRGPRGGGRTWLCL